MVRGHQKTLGKLKGAEKSAKNAELKALLGDISASVQMHLDKAKELQRAGTASLQTCAPKARDHHPLRRWTGGLGEGERWIKQGERWTGKAASAPPSVSCSAHRRGVRAVSPGRRRSMVHRRWPT